MKYMFKVIDNMPYLIDDNGNSIFLGGDELKKYIGEVKKFFDGEYLERDELSSEDESKIKYKLKIISSPIRDEYIVGCFSTAGTTSGNCKKNKDRKLFHVKPLNSLLPNFVVPYKKKETASLAIVFKYSGWKNLLPDGSIGNEGIILENNKSNWEKIIMYHCGIYPKKYFEFDKRIQNKIVDNSFNPLEENIKRNNFNELFPKSFTFSVDNESTIDYDDAFSIYEDEEDINIAVHIAQPNYWLSKSDLDEKVKSQVGTLYGNDRRLDLFGMNLTLACSLKEGELRPSYTILFRYSKEAEDIVIESYPSLITVDKNLSYESPELNEIKECSLLKIMTDKLTGLDNDYHDIVSYWMIEVNSYIGNTLYSNNIDKAIPYRVDEKKDIINLEKLSDDILPKEIKEKIDSRSNSKATYIYPSTEIDCNHHQLGLKNYCHFTSPIRRIVDAYIHYYLTYSQNTFLNLESLNKLDAKTRKFHMMINMKNKIDDAFGDESMITENVWIVKIINNNFVEVYLERLKIFKKINVYHPKFDYLVKDCVRENVDDFINSVVLNVSDSEGNINEHTFSVNQMYNIELCKVDETLPNKMISPFYLIHFF
jgi:exoribonuclease R